MKEKIIVDAFGGDNAPLEVIKGARLAVDQFSYDIILTGSEETIKKVAKDNNISLEGIEIYNTTQVITMEDSPSSVVKDKKDSSMAQGLKLLADGKADAFVSGGNSGALVVGATLIVKRIKGIKRPAFAPVMPKSDGVFMLIDSGANVECRAEMLEQFGLMGASYMENVMAVPNPRVGLANVGVEDHKGGDLQHEAFKLLNENKAINFVGNIEARDIPEDAADVVVADGFTGNIILKLYEGVAMTLMGKLKGVFKANIKTKLAAAIIMPQLKKFKKDIDYSEYGGAPVLGVRKPVYKTHGNADAEMFKNAIHFAVFYAKSGAIEQVENTMASKNISK